jgi:hypothetical protein
VLAPLLVSTRLHGVIGSEGGSKKETYCYCHSYVKTCKEPISETEAKWNSVSLGFSQWQTDERKEQGGMAVALFTRVRGKFSVGTPVILTVLFRSFFLSPSREMSGQYLD